MSNFQDTTIKNLVNGLNRTHFLPGIQREFVWKEEQIINLFDSILRGYPVGSFLFWRVEREKLLQLRFYNFIQHFHEKDRKHNEENRLDGEKEIISVLDGQQRLNSIFIGLKGTYTTKKKGSWKDNPNAYPKRKLYINLSSYNRKKTDIDNAYDLQFLEEKEVKNNKEWFKVGEIFNFELSHIINYTNENFEDKKTPVDILSRLHQSLCVENIISYYLEVDQNLDKVLDIFVRINSSGTKLSHSDLLLSVLTAQFTKINIRDEINTLVDDINNLGFDIDKNFILKSFLFLLDTPIKFILENFKKDIIFKIEENFEVLKDKITATFNFLKEEGFNGQILNSSYPATIVAYYLYKNNLKKVPQKERNNIKLFVIQTLLSQVFGGATDNVLAQIRSAIKEEGIISLEKINKKLTHKIKLDEESIDDYKYLQYNNAKDRQKIYLIFFLLYPHLDFSHHFHIDHIFPRKHFNKENLRTFLSGESEVERYIDLQNCLCNLQLLDGIENQEKSDTPVNEWLNNNNVNQEEWKQRHYISDNLSLDFTQPNNFIKVCKDREKKMLERLKRIFTPMLIESLLS